MNSVTSPAPLSRKFSVAPMLDWTDRHCRHFHRILSKNALLYTEMVTTGAILHGKGDFLAYNESEHPLALQLGGSEPAALAQCAKLAEARGYDEVNLNVGCPSDRVQNGRFGACLMLEPQVVADCVKAMRDQVSIPVTVKHRIGVDERESYAFLREFIDIVAAAGCESFTVHARKAWLSGLSPKENREIPPLDYSRVYQLKQDYPQLEIIINGGITDWDAIDTHLQHVDGVMIGREAYQNPYLLAEVDQRLFDDAAPLISRAQAVLAMEPYFHQQIAQGARFWHIARHMLGLFQNLPGARGYRRHLSTYGPKADSPFAVMREALAIVAPESVG